MKNNKLITKILIFTVLFGILSPFNASDVLARKDIIENVDVTKNAKGVEISWETDQKVISKFYYGLADPFGGIYKTEITNTNALTSHSVDLWALQDNRDYMYKIEVFDQRTGEMLDSMESRFEIKNAYEENVRQFKYFFMLTFNNFWESTKKNQPAKIQNQDGISFNTTGFSGKAMRINREGSFIEYDAKADELTTAYRGTLEMWVNFDNFDKDAVLWQEEGTGYTLKFEDKGLKDALVVNMGNGTNEISYDINPYANDKSKRWCTGEWHYVAMSWSGYESGTVKLFVDGQKVGESKYNNTDKMTRFRIGSGYENDEDYFGNGKIDEFKIHRWLMTEQNIKDTYYAYNFSPYFEKRGKCYTADMRGQVAGVQDQVREFKFGKLIKTPDNKVFVITRNEKKLYIENLEALAKYGTHPIIDASYTEANRYKTEGSFGSDSQYPDATLLKGEKSNTIYWVWDGEKRAIANEYVFNRYGNSWADVITVSENELKKYPTGFIYYR